MPIRLYGRAVALGAMLFASATFSFARTQISEASAIAFLKHATASRLDASLPSRSFENWVNEKFPGWAIRWEMKDCNAPSKAEEKDDEPACVQLDIMQPAQLANGVASRGFHLVFLVGSQKKGLLPLPRFRSGTEQQEESSGTLNSLSEVEP
jgi:hypothetical protein